MSPQRPQNPVYASPPVQFVYPTNVSQRPYPQPYPYLYSYPFPIRSPFSSPYQYPSPYPFPIQSPYPSPPVSKSSSIALSSTLSPTSLSSLSPSSSPTLSPNSLLSLSPSSSPPSSPTLSPTSRPSSSPYSPLTPPYSPPISPYYHVSYPPPPGAVSLLPRGAGTGNFTFGTFNFGKTENEKLNSEGKEKENLGNEILEKEKVKFSNDNNQINNSNNNILPKTPTLVIATNNYDGEKYDHLDIKKGEFLIITNWNCDEKGWVYGYRKDNTNEKGLIPEVFIKIYNNGNDENKGNI